MSVWLVTDLTVSSLDWRICKKKKKKSDSEDEEMLQCPAVREGNALDRRGRFITPKQLFNTEPPPPFCLWTQSCICKSATLFLLDVGVLQTPASVRVEDCTLTYIMMSLLYQFQQFFQCRQGSPSPLNIPAYHSRPAVKYLAGKCSPTPPGKKKKCDRVRSITIPSEGRRWVL